MTPEQEQWERVGRIFNAAIALQPEKRQSFLDQACGQDETLRREVESLLSLDGVDNRGFLSSPAIEDAAKLLTKAEPRFTAGQHLGNYEVLEFIALGGMGELYKARNITLGNSVALKSLPTALSEDANRLRRLKQEARAASALNHPNIVTVHDFVEADQSHFIVSEYVDGETLRERLRQGRIDVKDAINITTQIATGLGAAHAVGVIHRDIKPENIMLRPDGYVKILDFGLAKLNEQSVTNLSQSSQLKTEPGTPPIGTPRYMSPEQIRGLPLDARTDVWSLGVVLYEMLSGREPFEGKTNSDVLASILAREPPPLASSMSDVPPRLQRIVSKALQKDREERYQSVADLLLDLKRLSEDESLFEKLKRYATAVAMMLAVLVVAVAFGPALLRWARSRLTPPPRPLPPMKISQLTSFVGFEDSPAFSPDGNFLAFTWTGEKNDNQDIYIMQIGGTGPPFRLTYDPGVDLHPVWSPDGRQIAFARYKSETDKACFIIPALGGPERKIYTSQIKGIWGGAKLIDWSPDGRFLAAPERLTTNGLFHIFLTSTDTLERQQITFAPEHSLGDLFPQFSPDGKSVAFVRGNDFSSQDIYVLDLAGGEPRRLTFEANHIEALTWTNDGKKLIYSSNRDGQQRLWTISASGGTPEAFAVNDIGASAPSISRKGNRLAFVKRLSDSNMYSISLKDPSSSARTPFASSTKRDFLPSFSPDGRRVAFTSDRSGASEIWVCNNDGSSLHQLTTTATGSGMPTWSPDGQFIAFDSLESGGTPRHVYVISADGGVRRRLTPLDNYDDNHPSWSRDGKWIYFASKRSGAEQIWKVAATGGTPEQVTQQGGTLAFESPDGQFVYYGKSGVPGIWKLPVNGGDEVSVLDHIEGSWGYWAVVADGIYYISFTKKGWAIQFYNFSSKRTTEVASLGFVAVEYRGLAVSPDGQSAIYTLIDKADSDIWLVDNYTGQ